MALSVDAVVHLASVSKTWLNRLQPTSTDTSSSKKSRHSFFADLIVVEQQDGSLKCSDFIARFSKKQSKRLARGKVGILAKINGYLVDWKLQIDKDGYITFDGRPGPSQEELQSLHLTRTVNEISLGTSIRNYIVRGYIFKYNHDAKIFISDFDGTITKGDISGFILPNLGFKWCYTHVIDTLRNLEEKGYQIFYLSSRSVHLISGTRRYLNNIEAPMGPIMLQQHSFLRCVRFELEKQALFYKISRLLDLSKLFNNNPFAGGVGNKESDRYAYQVVGVPEDHIALVDEDFECFHNMNVLDLSKMEIEDSVDLCMEDVIDLEFYNE
ncbi:hypothetical protein PCE1_004247 [Barthelona sp. PCE]